MFFLCVDDVCDAFRVEVRFCYTVHVKECPRREVEYCDEYVCLFVCPHSAHISGTECPNFAKFSKHVPGDCGSGDVERSRENGVYFQNDSL